MFFKCIKTGGNSLKVILADGVLAVPDLIERVDHERRNIGHGFGTRPVSREEDRRTPGKFARCLGWWTLEAILPEQQDKASIELNSDQSAVLRIL